MKLEFSTDLAVVAGFKRHVAELNNSGLFTVEDLLFRLPFRYEDRSVAVAIADLEPGAPAMVRVEVVKASVTPTRRQGFALLEADVRDATGSLRVVFFNQRYLADVLIPGAAVDLYGKVERDGLFAELRNPDVERTPSGGTESVHTGRIVPVYERVGRLGPRVWRTSMNRLLQQLLPVPEVLPLELVRDEGLLERDAALRSVHFPLAIAIAELNDRRSSAHRRLAFEELFIEQLGLAWSRRADDERSGATALRADDDLRARLRACLPFRLTTAQRRVLAEIGQDLGRTRPMRRLLQGDVGSGKTVIAALAMALAASCGQQAALMAPTALLAEQHARSIETLLEPAGLTCVLLTSATRKRRETLEGIANGSIPLVIGTHAIIQAAVQFRNLALVVVDEQHRFGVGQREGLEGKGREPHTLVMTATPIPRSLALTVYGDLDLSVLDELPPGRRPVRTVLRVADSEGRTYSYVRAQVEAGRQAYVVCPLVEEGGLSDLKAAEEWSAHIAETYFRGYQVGLVHGKLKSADRIGLMRRFAAGEIHVMVATTVIEVGVDVANASVMVIEHAERFGLSQLHQLRGRIGRGQHRSTCFLMIRAAVTDVARQRLEVMRRTSDGFAISEADLRLRGPGELFGTRQWGMPSFRVANILRDFELLLTARRHAQRLAADSAWSSSQAAQRLRSCFEKRFAGARRG